LISWHTGKTIEDMETITLKLDRRHIQRLKDQAAASGRSQAAVVRDLIDRHLGGRNRSLHDQARDLCGSISGAKDMSTRRLRGYGRD
jgi:bacterioferritin (cytochrome b1)